MLKLTAWRPCRASISALPEVGLLEALQLHLQLGEQSRQMQATQLLVDLRQLHSQRQDAKDADSNIQPLQVHAQELLIQLHPLDVGPPWSIANLLQLACAFHVLDRMLHSSPPLL